MHWIEIIFGLLLLTTGYIIVWHCVIPPKVKNFLRECLPCFKKKNSSFLDKRYKKARKNTMSAIND